MHDLYLQKVKLNEETHRYFDDAGKEYISFSKLYDTFMADPFNSTGAAYGTAKSEGITAQAVLDRWEAQRAEGCRIDDGIDYFSKTGKHRPEDADIADGIEEVLKTYTEYHKSYGQLVLFSENYRVAGMCDRLSVVSNRKDCPIIMSDFKCFEKEITFMPSGSPRFLKAPFNHLANTKYMKIVFQLSYYSYLFESLTGRMPIRQFIHWIDPRTMKRNEDCELKVNHKLIEAPYLKSDVILFLETYKEKILTLAEPRVIEAW